MVIKMKEIAEYILQKLDDKTYDKTHLYHIITKTGEIYKLDEYEDLIKEDPGISSAYIFVANLWFSYEPTVYYPFIGENGLLLEAYLRKYYYYKTHFNDLKYITIIVHFSKTSEAFMEVVDLEIAVNNTNLPKLMQLLNEDKNHNKNKDVVVLELDFDEQGRLWLSVKDADNDEDEYEKIRELEERFEAQSLFGRYSFQEAAEIINKYYNENNELLGGDVKAIKDAYNYIFKPYRIVLL